MSSRIFIATLNLGHFYLVLKVQNSSLTVPLMMRQNNFSATATAGQHKLTVQTPTAKTTKYTIACTATSDWPKDHMAWVLARHSGFQSSWGARPRRPQQHHYPRSLGSHVWCTTPLFSAAPASTLSSLATLTTGHFKSEAGIHHSCSTQTDISKQQKRTGRARLRHPILTHQA